MQSSTTLFKPTNNKELRDAIQHYFYIGNTNPQKIIEPYGPIEEWDTSLVTDFSNIFACNWGDKMSIEGDLSNWSVSQVTTMESMCEYCNFKCDI